MKIFNFNNEFTEKVNLEKFTLKFNGNCINNEIFKYLSQVNILDDLRRSIFLITNDEIEKYNCFLTAIFFLQKKKAENAKKNIILPPDIRVLYRGIEYNLNSAVIENNHVCLKKGNNAASISLTEFDFLKPYTLPYNSGYQNQLNGLDTFKKYARILLLENINAIFDTNYYEEFKPEEGIVLISNNKKKIRSLFKNSSVVYNEQEYHFYKFFQINDLDVNHSKSNTEFIYNPVTHTSNFRTNLKNKINKKDYPNLLLISYNDLHYLEYLNNELFENFYKTIIFDSFDSYYPNPDLFFNRNTENDILARRNYRLEPLFKLVDLQKNKKIKDIIFLSDSKLPEVVNDLTERAAEKDKEIQLHSWYSHKSIVRSNTTTLKIINFNRFDLYFSIKDSISNANYSLKSITNELCNNLDDLNTFNYEYRKLTSYLLRKLNLFFNPECLQQEIKNSIDKIKEIAERNFKDEIAQYNFLPFSNYIDFVNSINLDDLQNSKLDNLKEELKNTQGEIVIVFNKNNYDDVEFINSYIERKVLVKSRTELIQNKDIKFENYFFIDFDKRDFVNFYDLFITEKAKYILNDNEIKFAKSMFDFYTRLYNRIYSKSWELFHLNDINEFSNITFSDELIFKQNQDQQNAQIIQDENEDISTVDKLLNSAILESINAQHKRYFTNKQGEPMRWVLIFDNGQTIAYPEGKKLLTVENENVNVIIENQDEDEDENNLVKTLQTDISAIETGSSVLLIDGDNNEYKQILNAFLKENNESKKIYENANIWLDRLRAIRKKLRSNAELKRLLSEYGFIITPAGLNFWLEGQVTEPEKLQELLEAFNNITEHENCCKDLPMIDIENSRKSVRLLKKIKSQINRNVRRISLDINNNYNLIEQEPIIYTLFESFKERINLRTVITKIDLNALK